VASLLSRAGIRTPRGPGDQGTANTVALREGMRDYVMGELIDDHSCVHGSNAIHVDTEYR
jgi:hypothetical protein